MLYAHEESGEGGAKPREQVKGGLIGQHPHAPPVSGQGQKERVRCLVLGALPRPVAGLYPKPGHFIAEGGGPPASRPQ